MERSLTVPTATSFRNVSARLLEVNRKVINGYRARSGQGKVSFTHLIGYAVVRAIADAVPAMNNVFLQGADGKPRLVKNEHVNMGLAVDVDKGDGTRMLVVPVLRDAEALDFAGFLVAYEEIIRKVRSNKLAVADFQGASVTLTNPGTIGTVQSVPRLMPGQGVIVGVGTIDYPAEFEGADRSNLSSLGISKVVTITSTYDHRIIQGAESGLFLKRVHELLLGEHGFYDDIFHALGMPYEAVKWRPDVNPIDREEAMLHKQVQVAKLIRVHRVRGHLIADLDPLRWKEAAHSRRARSGHVRTHDLGSRPRVPHRWCCAAHPRCGWATCSACSATRTAAPSASSTCTSRRPTSSAGSRARSKAPIVGAEGAEGPHPRTTQRGRGVREVPRHEVRRHQAVRHRGRRVGDPHPRRDPLGGGRRRARLGRHRDGPPRPAQRACPTSWARATRRSSPSSKGTSTRPPCRAPATSSTTSARPASTSVPSGADIRLELAANPSHLETVDPVVMGIVGRPQDQIDPPGSYPALSLLIHGDAAFAGQGIVAECLAMSDISGYRVGGTIHLIINNQIGFTTSPQFARSSIYCTDVAKTVQAPIFHVNGDDPEACVRVARMAWEYRQQFHKDVVIDMVCYRRHGHNEGDDPSYTQPLMYKAIAERRSVRKLYVETLVKRGDITVDEAEQALSDFQSKLQVALDETRAQAPTAVKAAKPPKPLGVLPHIPTGVDRPVLDRVFHKLTDYPQGFTIHPKLAKQFEARTRMYEDEGKVDWATAESLAIGSLVLEGIRSGSPARTHAAARSANATLRWSTTKTVSRGSRSTSSRVPRPASGCTTRSSREYAALGFEYGYAHANHARARRCGRPSSATSSTAPRSSSISSWSPPRTSGTRERPRAAPPARVRRAGTRTLVGAHRAVPDPRRRGQHPTRQRDDRGPVLPPAPASGPRANVARRSSCSRRSRGCG